MSESKSPINLMQLFDQHQQIQIPIIQRDYAQGRTEEREIREEFLDTLFDTLTLLPGNESLPLNLDFVYGSVEGEEESLFFPLDGQQRLTTLFLLHWYLSRKEAFYEDFKSIFRIPDQARSRLSYRIRPSCKEFFDELINFVPDQNLNNSVSLSEIIQDQPWFFSRWRLDATVQSSLTMIDAIHEKFWKCPDKLFERLIDTRQPAITFQLLNLKEFGLDDDLYIKMNARGIPLTTFETFKARYEKFLETEFAGETRLLDHRIVSVTQYFAILMDTKWTDFFWDLRNPNTHLIDEAVMNLMRLIALVTRDASEESYEEHFDIFRSDGIKSTYSEFDKNNWLDREFTETLFLLLETWSSGDNGEFSNQLPNKDYFDEESMFEKAVSQPTRFTYVEIIQFTAYVSYLRAHNAKFDAMEFQEWMRIVLNLSLYTRYHRASDIRSSVRRIAKFVKKIPSEPRETLRFFAKIKAKNSGFNRRQTEEEKLKATLMLVDNRWKSLIRDAENHKYFKGQIEFLLDFCGVRGNSKKSDPVDWAAAEHQTYQNEFLIYLGKSKRMFTENGIRKLELSRWERALLCYGDYLLPSGLNRSFLVNRSTVPASWKQLLQYKNRLYICQLWDDLEDDDELINQLDAIISEAEGLPLWRQELVLTPKAIEYCERRSIRKNYVKASVYLLKTTQMNGRHVELFTYCFYHNHLIDTSTTNLLKPLHCFEYIETMITGEEPGIQFKWSYGKRSLTFHIEYHSGDFEVYIFLSILKKLPKVIHVLQDEVNFKQQGKKLKKVIRPNETLVMLDALSSALTANF